MDIQGRASVSCNGVYGQYVHLYVFNTVWDDMIPTRNFAKPIHAKIKAATIIQEATPNVGNLFIIKMCTTKMGFNLDQADIWFNP